MSGLSKSLDEHCENFYRELGAVPICGEDFRVYKEYVEHVERVVIPQIVESFEQLHEVRLC